MHLATNFGAQKSSQAGFPQIDIHTDSRRDFTLGGQAVGTIQPLPRWHGVLTWCEALTPLPGKAGTASDTMGLAQPLAR